MRQATSDQGSKAPPGFLLLGPRAPGGPADLLLFTLLRLDMSSITEDAQDDVALEQLGYKQELRRGMTLLCVTLCAVHMQLFI